MRFYKDLTSTIYIIIGILTGIGLSIFPPVGDDLLFMTPSRDAILNGGTYDFTKIWDLICFTYTNVNARLGNIIMAGVIAPLPRWVGGMLSGAAVSVILIAGRRIISSDAGPFISALWAAAVIIGLPWYDQLYLIDFQLNYIWPSAIMLVYLKLLIVGKLGGGVKHPSI